MKKKITKIYPKTSEYHAWANIKTRCYNKNSPDYKDYGERGIVMCERWRNSFALFLEDMGLKPSKNHSIDRFPNNDGNYEPGNCRWATPIEQSRNTRNNVWIEFNGENKLLKDWAALFNINPQKIRELLRTSSADKIFPTYLTKSAEHKNAQP